MKDNALSHRTHTALLFSRSVYRVDGFIYLIYLDDIVSISNRPGNTYFGDNTNFFHHSNKYNLDIFPKFMT